MKVTVLLFNYLKVSPKSLLPNASVFELNPESPKAGEPANSYRPVIVFRSKVNFDCLRALLRRGLRLLSDEFAKLRVLQFLDKSTL